MVYCIPVLHPQCLNYAKTENVFSDVTANRPDVVFVF